MSNVDLRVEEARLDDVVLRGMDVIDQMSKDVRTLVMKRSLTPEEMLKLVEILNTVAQGYLHGAEAAQSIRVLKRQEGL